MTSKKPVVLFLCTGNSIRSQMSEAYLTSLSEGNIKAYSAGVSPSFLHPLTQEVLLEDGLNTEGMFSKSVLELPYETVTTLITLCDNAVLHIPKELDFINERIHWSTADPITMPGSQDSRLQNFRRVRDLIRGKVITFLKQIPKATD